MRGTARSLRYAVPSAVAGGVVYVLVSLAVDGTVDFVGGAAFMLAFGLVVTIGLVLADRREAANDRERRDGET